MKNLKLILTFALVAWGFLYGADVLAAIDQPSFVTGDGERQINDIGGRIYGFLMGVAAVVAGIYGVTGGIVYMKDKDKGTDMVQRAIIGLVIVSCVAVIYYFIGG